MKKIFKVQNHVEGLTGADLVTDRFRQGRRWRLASGVFLVTKTERIRLMAGVSNGNDAL